MSACAKWWYVIAALGVLTAVLVQWAWIFVPNVDEKASTVQLLDTLKEIGSSVSCHGKDRLRRVCKLEYACFNPSEGDFFLVRPNIDAEPGPLWTGEALASERSQMVFLSTVGEHAQHALQIVDVTSVNSMDVTFVTEPTYVLRRFKPDNLMHAVHDDLLPLFRELEKLTYAQRWEARPHSKRRHVAFVANLAQSFPYRLFYVDDFDEYGDHDDLYSIMSSYQPMYKNALQRDNGSGIICFREIYAGFDRSTLWYQYGFDRPQGPLPVSSSAKITLRRFSSYASAILLGSERGSQPKGVGSRYLVLLCRRGNRLILNEDELALALARACLCRVRVAAAETHSMRELVGLVSGAIALVGVHGALLALAAFLPRRAALVELFPYALQPERYAPYRALAAVADLRYAAWQNRNRSATRGHPERAPELGGLGHLPAVERQRVLDAEDVAPHLCCSDASWLYHAYQDTTVDTGAVADLLAGTLEWGSARSLPAPRPLEQLVGCSQGLLPARPNHVRCTLNATHVTMQWKAPWNLDLINCTHSEDETQGTGTYEVMLEGAKGHEQATVAVSGLAHAIRYTSSAPVNVWVRFRTGDTVGLWSSYTKCERDAE